MLKCNICNKIFKNLKGLNYHKKFHFMNEEQRQLFRQKANEKRKQTNFKKYGVDSPLKNEEIKQKSTQTKLNNIDENGLNSFQRGVIKQQQTKLNNIDENGLNIYQQTAKKVVQTRIKNDSYKSGSIKAKQTLLNKIINGKNGYQLLIEKTLRTKSQQIFKDGLNGFQHETKKAFKTVKQKYNVNNALCLGKHTNSGFSKISLKLFSDILDALPESLVDSTYFHGHNGEVKFHKLNGKYIFIDFIIKDILFAIEFNGDYWHANPKFYKQNDIIKFPNNKLIKTKEIWQYNDNKKHILQFNGYKLLTIWESDYRKNPDLVLQNCLKEISNRIYGKN